MKWTFEEELFLRENYNNLSSIEISKIIRKSRSAILTKAWKLGLKKDLTKPETKSINNIEDLPRKTQQIILGSVLGDGSIIKRANSYFSEAHSLKQENYLRWKVEKMNVLKPKIFYVKNDNCNNIGFKTKTFFVLNKYYEMFHSNGKKKITEGILNQLEPLGLAVWIMDDGTYDYFGKRIEISTNDFSYDEHLLMKKWFENKLFISPTITKRRNQYVLKFNVKDTEKLIKIIKPFIIPSMRYKIGENKLKRKNALRKYKEYRQRKDVKERRRLVQIKYRKRPEVRKKIEEYNNRLKVKERKKIWARLHRNAPLARV